MHNEDALSKQDIQVSRKANLLKKVVFVDGQAGCGKTMLSPIVAALKRVELLTYAYEIEYICALYALDKIACDAAITLIKLFCDLKLYNLMMGREANCRLSDLSSIFRDVDRWTYIKRLFAKGDFAVPDRIDKENPILHLTTHNLLPYSEPIFAGLGDKCVFIEVVRHPLYMIKQQILNMKNIVSHTRDFTIYFLHHGIELPFYTQEIKASFLNANPTEKAIYCIHHLTKLYEEKRKYLRQKYNAQIIIVPFETYVLDPLQYMENICNLLGAQMTTVTRRMMKKQNIPRKKYADGIGLKVYKRCGWKPAKRGLSEEGELAYRWRVAAKSASPAALAILDKLCVDYEKKYLGCEKQYEKKYPAEKIEEIQS